MKNTNTDLENQIFELTSLRNCTGLNRTAFAKMFGIPIRTVEDWESGRRKMPNYLLRLIAYRINIEKIFQERNNIFVNEDNSQKVSIITDENGKSIVIINDIRFKSRRNIDWNEIEDYLKEYIGKCYEIAETAEKIYIGSDFPDEFAHSIDTKKLKGANIKAKANISPVVGGLIQIATNKAEYQDINGKHKSKAKLGWYRYDTRFGIPAYNDNGELERYNIFSARMLVRCDANGKLYLYDFVRTKKETSRPLEQ
ncbi:MAG: transcriptional regulator [Lachnospiraceae bacterium]|nr:transcriptional regulator [Lachnospiraceae bacterium]